MLKHVLAAISAMTMMISSASATPTVVFQDDAIKMGYLQSGDVVSRAGYSQCATSIGDSIYVRSGNVTRIFPSMSVDVDSASVTIRKNQYVTNERGAYVCYNDTPTAHRITTGYVQSGTNIGAGLKCVLTIGNFYKHRQGCSGCGGSVSCSYNSATGVLTSNQTERGDITHCGYVCVDPEVSTRDSDKHRIVARQYSQTSGTDTLKVGASVAVGTNSFFSECSNTEVTGASYSSTTGTVTRGSTHHCGHMSFTYITSGAAQCSDGADNDQDGLIDANDPGCSTPDDDSEENGSSQCHDGIDNDGDGATDYPADFSCSSATDTDETTPYSQCQDGVDNDGDGATDFPADFSCASAQDNDETNQKPQCQDGADNDSDGATDFPADFSCASAQDNDETYPKSQCQDGVDNDSDGLVDMDDPGCSSPQGNSEGRGTVQCQDTVDNDGDGATDYPADFSCSSATDTDEANPKSQCQDGVDNDGDSATDFPADFSCSSAQDNDETNQKSQCQDGADNDSDGATDFPADFSCASAQDNDETNPKSQCQDGIDNDSDGLVDMNDPGCTSQQGNDEGAATPQCSDGSDNDADGTTDYPADFSCSTATDNDETSPRSQCQDGIDNDTDGAKDYPADFSCSSVQDNDETNPKSQCQDGIDNDSDGLIDMNDPGCASPQGNDEGAAAAQCSDGSDNDGDGATDFPADFSCSAATDNDETNPKAGCQDGTDNDSDGAVDYPADFSCQSAQDNDEANPKSQCQDGQDNDSDGLIDMNDPGCSGAQDNNEDDETARLAVAVECVMDNADGGKTAYFSYNNATQQVLTVPVSASGTLINAFSPGLPDQGQPTLFIPGVAKGVVGVPFTGSTVAWTVRASGSAQSSALASAASPKCAAVQPLIECQGYESGQLRAKGGYLNSNPFDVRLNYGRLNFFTPGSANRGQPTVFKSGLNKASFGIALSDPSAQLLWDLNGQKITASNALPVCDGECINTAVGEIRGELNDLAIQIAQLTIDAADVLASAGDSNASGSAKSSSKRRRAQAAANAADAQRAKAKAESYVQQSNTLTIQFPDVIKNCPDAPQYCETVDRGATIDQLRALFSQARNQAQRTIARAYFKQTGSTNRKDKLVRKAKDLEAQGLAELDKLPRTETVCK